MPILPHVDTETLQDHFFGSGAFSFGWFSIEDPFGKSSQGTFPVKVIEWDGDEWVSSQIITEKQFLNGIAQYAETLTDRSFQDLIEDMDAVDVDNVIQLICFGEIIYS